MVVVFTASVPDGENDPEFDLFFSYIMESVEPSTAFPFLELTLVITSTIGLVVVIVVFYLKRARGGD